MKSHISFTLSQILISCGVQNKQDFQAKKLKSVFVMREIFQIEKKNRAFLFFNPVSRSHFMLNTEICDANSL